MGTNTGHVLTLANSIIGVSVLAMPFCFKQCGIILATLMLILSSIMTRLACYYLIKSAILARRRNFEYLAFHIFGPTGKLTVELSIIGFMLGTCVAFFVVVGDLGPAILSPIVGIENPSSIRATVLIGIALFVVLPLGLLRNVDSLAAICAATIAFYICLVFKVMGEATTHLVAWDWVERVSLWRPAGLLQCIPIFSMALSCQTQLFEIFDSIPNCTLEKMTVIVRSAVNLCTLMYVAMGFFGYIAFCTQPFSGNLMLSFSPTPTSEVIKLGFVLSVAVSFPLVIFPCRASLHSLLFRKGIPPHHELLSVSNHMPEARFKCITLVIVAVSLVTGLLIPNIELVLGLVGSTIGVLICVIIPATFFLCLTTKNNNERLLAQVLFIVGILIMVLGSYANLYATEKAISNNEPAQPKLQVRPPELPALNSVLQHPEPKVELKDETLKEIKNVEQLAAALPKLKKESPASTPKVQLVKNMEKAEQKADVRKEPPVPEAPMVKVVSETPLEEIKKIEPPIVIVEPAEKKEDTIHHDAIKKEDDEIKEVQKQEILKKKEELIEKLEQNEEKQKRLLEEQKKILQDIKLEKEKLVEENKQLKNIEKEKEDKRFNIDKLNIQNKVIVDDNKQVVIPAVREISVIPAVKNIFNEEESKAVNTMEEYVKINKDGVAKKQETMKIIKDDLVKKNMADGVPLPIAVQHIASRVDGIKSVKIVDNNNANPREGNVDSKVLQREILEKTELREQREKRDVVEIINIYLKEFENDLKEEKENVHDNLDDSSSKTVLQIDQVAEEVDKLKIDPVNTEPELAVDIAPSDKQSEVIVAGEVKKIDSTDLIGKINNAPQPAHEDELEHCTDKNKSIRKYSDDFKISEVAMRKTTQISKNDIGEGKTINGEVKSVSVVKNEAKAEESIVKSPVYLSNPNILLPSDNIESGVLENKAIINNAAKPMKRDLKSLNLKQSETLKESET